MALAVPILLLNSYRTWSGFIEKFRPVFLNTSSLLVCYQALQLFVDALFRLSSMTCWVPLDVKALLYLVTISESGVVGLD